MLVSYGPEKNTPSDSFDSLSSYQLTKNQKHYLVFKRILDIIFSSTEFDSDFPIWDCFFTNKTTQELQFWC